MNQYELALKIATEAHEGQKRKFTGEPYINHPIRVAQEVARIQDIPKEYHVYHAALLHDVLEDNPEWTVERLLNEGVAYETVRLVRWLTRKPNQSYLSYLKRVMSHPDSIAIKKADILDNLNNCPEGSLRSKYELALYILRDLGK